MHEHNIPILSPLFARAHSLRHPRSDSSTTASESGKSTSSRQISISGDSERSNGGDGSTSSDDDEEGGSDDDTGENRSIGTTIRIAVNGCSTNPRVCRVFSIWCLASTAQRP